MIREYGKERNSRDREAIVSQMLRRYSAAKVRRWNGDCFDSKENTDYTQNRACDMLGKVGKNELEICTGSCWCCPDIAMCMRLSVTAYP